MLAYRSGKVGHAGKCCRFRNYFALTKPEDDRATMIEELPNGGSVFLCGSIF